MLEEKTIGYLPDESPSYGRLFIFAIQQIIVMFPATVLVALLTGFHVSTTIFARDLQPHVSSLLLKRKSYIMDSRFSYIAAIVSITGAKYGWGLLRMH